MRKKLSVGGYHVDAGIRDLVSILNAIPFVETESSCEGHLRDVKGMGCLTVFPDKDHKFLDSGDLIFRVDRRYKLTKEFLIDLKNLRNKYPFVNLSEHHCDTYKCRIEGFQSLYLDFADLTNQELCTKTDDFELQTKQLFQVPTEVGEKRIAEFKQAWSDCLAIAIKYFRLARASGHKISDEFLLVEDYEVSKKLFGN